MFQRIAIVNRGEAAMRLIHAVRDLNAQAGPGGHRIETVALHTEAERSAMFVREADAAYDLGPASLRPYLDHAVLERALLETGAGCRVGRLGLRRRGPHLRRAVRAHRRDLHRAEPRGDAPPGRQDRLEADRRGGRRPRRAVEPGRGRHPRRRHRRRGPDRLPADAQGHRWRRRARHPQGHLRRRARRRLRAHPRRGAARLRLGRGLPREAGHRCPARRGAGHRRRPGVGVGDRRARLLGAAPQPEGHRGVVVARARRRPDRRAQGLGRAARHRGRVCRCRHRRVPLPPARPVLRLPRGQHPPAGRAPDHRGRHRHRPGAAADPRGVRRPAHGPPARRGRARRRGAAQRRGPRPRLRAGTGAHRPPRAAGRPRHPRRHGCRGG